MSVSVKGLLALWEFQPIPEFAVPDGAKVHKILQRKGRFTHVILKYADGHHELCSIVRDPGPPEQPWRLMVTARNTKGK